MRFAALAAWVTTVVFGFRLLGRWVTGVRRQPFPRSALPSPVVFVHMLFAGLGLVTWLVFLNDHQRVLAWVAFGIALFVASLGLTLYFRWLGGRGAPPPEEWPSGELAEHQMPVAIIAGHGFLAATTIVLVLLAALGVGAGR